MREESGRFGRSLVVEGLRNGKGYGRPGWHKTILLVTVVAISVAIYHTPGGAAAQTAAAGRTSELRRALQEKLDSLHKAGQFPGATAGIALADETVLGLATGLADRESGRKMTEKDLMLQGSVGKTYAAALALQLVSEGRLSLEDKIEKHLGREAWFDRLPNSRAITIRMLMNHTSGLVRYEFKEQFTKDLTANPAKTWKPEELLSYLFDTKAPFAAGEGWDYSDTNYIVLGMIIERVTGKRYYDLVKERLLKPLKLNETVPSDRRRIAGLVQGYAGANNPFGGTDAMIVNGEFVINPQFEWTGGGMASTSADLARWAKALYEGRAFKPEMLEKMLDGVQSKLGPNVKYGLGVIVRPTPLGTSYGHSGFFPGYMTEMHYFPDHKVAVAVQVNTSVPRTLGGKPLGRIAIELAEIVTGAK